jgi:transcriptional regulator CtsR
VDGDQYALDYIAKHEKTFAQLQAMKLDEIRLAFENAALNGRFTSSLGFDVNARRGGIQNDLQNVEALISLGATQFRDADKIMRNITALDLVTIKTEMQQYGLGLYEHKWQLEAAVNAAVDEADLEVITW